MSKKLTFDKKGKITGVLEFKIEECDEYGRD